MTVLIAGGDRIATLERTLHDAGYQHLRHWHGRKAGQRHWRMPADLELVVMVVDQISHSFAARIRRDAAQLGVPIAYTARSPLQLARVLAERDDTKVLAAA